MSGSEDATGAQEVELGARGSRRAASTYENAMVSVPTLQAEEDQGWTARDAL